jgi:hypothetical protein
MRILRHYVHQAHIKVFGRALQFRVHARNLMMQQTTRTPRKSLLVAKEQKKRQTKHRRPLGRFSFQRNESIANDLMQPLASSKMVSSPETLI